LIELFLLVVIVISKILIEISKFRALLKTLSYSRALHATGKS